MTQKIITLTFFLFSIITFSQNTNKNITISGKIIEEGTGAPLEYATVSFINPSGFIVTGGITDLEGNYVIEVPTGQYTVRYEFISFKTLEKTNQTLFENTTLPTVTLSLDSDSLDEIVVIAETTEVQVRLDKKIYYIGKDLTTSGATVSDALNNVPSVTVDVEGAIALRGNENVRILINGRPSAIAGFGSTDALRQLPAEAIERVEVITSPSARYDAEGTAGILNIILRKEKTRGVNGSIITNFGYPETAGFTGNINIRSDKFNLFNTTGIQYRRSPGNAFFNNTFNVDPANPTSTENPFLTEDRAFDRVNRNFNTNLGIEYFLSETSSITGSIFVRSGNGEDETINETSELDFDRLIVDQLIRTEIETEDEIQYQGALNYRNEIGGNSDHLLTLDLQYEISTEEEGANITELQTFDVIADLPRELVTSIQDQTELLIQGDYVLPLGENAQFEAGFRGNFNETITDYELLEEVATSGVFEVNTGLTNVFTFEENITAIYTQYGNKLGEKFSFLAGLRAENTQFKGSVLDANANELGANFNKQYFGLFPTLNLIYEIGLDQNITLGYNRRINRPRGRFVNPFPSRSSENNIFQGNPNLDPAFSNAFDLGYLKRWDKLTLTSSIYYQRETDSFERIQEDTGELTPNGIPIIRTIPINLSVNDRYGFEAGVLYNPAKWLQLNGSFNYFNFVSQGSFNGVEFGTENSSWFARGSSKVTLPAKIEWQTNAFYRGPINNAQTETEGILSVNVALSKDFMNDNATIGFNISDVFNSRIRRSFTEGATFTSESEFQWRVRQFNLTFNYRFNQKKKHERGGRDGGDDDGFEG